MALMAKWNRKTWEVNSSNVLTIQDLTFSYSQTADNNNSTEEKKQTNVRGKELFPLNFTTVLHKGLDVNFDIRKEIEDWESLVSKVDYFFLGSVRLGPAVQLRKVSVSDVKLSNSGEMLYAKLSFEFKEYDQESSSVKADVPALEVSASEEAKALRKEQNDQLANAEVQGIKIGDRVKIISTDYLIGASNLSEEELEKSHIVSNIVADRLLLGFHDGGIGRWIFAEGVTLV